MQLRHVINLHKGLTPLVVLGLMAAYGNFGSGYSHREENKYFSFSILPIG
jgi:hypothetical protein